MFNENVNTGLCNQECYRIILQVSNNTSNNTNSKWDTSYIIMLIEGYPKNRIQSKNPVIKLLKDLDKDQIALILKNKERYLKASNGYVKNLRKYIEEECWSEEWLNLQESTNKTKKTGITNNTDVINNASSFIDRNRGFFTDGEK